MIKKLFARKPLKLLLAEMEGENRLRRVLGPIELTALGVGCTIGAGIFVQTGVVAHNLAGPAIILSFVVAGIACVFAALSYAEFAAMVPVAGSAYTYAYATLGELIAWIIGWDLIIEYTIAASSIAEGWSGYLQTFLASVNIYLPKAIAKAPFEMTDAGHIVRAVGSHVDLPAILIALALTVLLVIGIRESTRVNNVVVGLKVLIVSFVIAVGAFYVHSANWHPFAPHGYGGVSLFWGTWVFGEMNGTVPLGMLAGAAIVFYAYIGFDTVSAHTEEARNPQRDVPIGIIASLVICTILYVAVAAVLTGMVPSGSIDTKAPIAVAFKQIGLDWAQFIVGAGAMAGLTSVLLALMLGQARVALAMARDGLLPARFFGAVHRRFRTPHKSTILTGLIVAVLAGVIPLRILIELISIGTLLAFVIVCIGVVVVRHTHPDARRPFRCPFVPWSQILGVVLCLTLMFSLPLVNWLRLAVWLVIGLVIYFAYGRKNSVLARLRAEVEEKELVEAPRG